MIKGFCLTCFKDIRYDSKLSSLFLPFPLLCNECYKKLPKLDKKDKFHGIDIHFLYYYDGLIRQSIYLYKGCYDYELKDLFLYYHKDAIKKEYKGYTIIFPPSSKQDDAKRKYIHIYEMVKCLNMPILNVFYKKIYYKQSNHKFEDRKNIKDIISLKEGVVLKNIKYLIIDDIFTSGSTIKTIIDILIKNKVKKENIKCLIVAKTKDITII